VTGLKAALFLGVGTFIYCWLLHFALWRIRRPEAYPIWLLLIFFGVPAVTVLVFAGFGLLSMDLSTAIAAGFLHVVISSCYICGYAGVIEYSPSAEILRVVRNHMPDGIAPEELSVSSLSEEALTDKRIRHLRDAGMTEEDNGVLRLSARGRFVVAACLVYRRVFGLKEEARG
jgi:hypothetical protein